MQKLRTQPKLLKAVEGLRERTEYVQRMKLRKSLVKPGRNPAIITCCSVLPPEIVMHDSFNFIL